MTELTAAESRILDALDVPRMVASLVELVRVPSVTGTDAESELQRRQAGSLADLDPSLRERLEHAIECKGAFRRLRDLAHAEGIAEQWDIFSSDRQLGRAREVIAEKALSRPAADLRGEFSPSDPGASFRFRHWPGGSSSSGQ